MAYALRYYKELTHADGTVIRLEIHKKDSTTAAVEIGAVVQRLSLEIQGQQDDIDSPIQKTSLHMTFVDASDIENGQKNGFWQEFYTPDALMWKVILKAKDAKETAFRTIWGGYVTPDSFSEDLVYRGSVSITARDNIGHMQDFPFDAEGDADGMISLYNLVESGWEKIQSPMMLEWRGEADSTMWLECDGVSAMFTLMNVSMFEGMDWYKAIETALASYGVVMRYIGNNIVKMSSLRSMPYQGAENIEDLIHIEPTFVSGATRELIPAVKRIEESVGYDLGEEYQPRIDTQDFSGNTFNVETSWGTVENIAWSLLQSAPMSDFGWYNETPFKTLAFNPSAYEVDDRLSDSDKEDLHKYTCVLTGSKDDNTHSLSYAMSVNAEDFAINVTFGKFLSRLTHGYGDYFLGYPANEPPADYSVRFAVSVQANGITYYLAEHGVWSTEFASQKIVVSGDKMSVNVPLSGKYTGRVNVSFTFLNIDTSEEAVRVKQILALSLSSASNKPMLENNTINTSYQEENNVILTRDPEFAPAMNATALPALIKNGIFYRQGDVILPARKWSWGSGSEQQMAVWNHLQLLCYYAKPNNLISGTIVNADITRAKAIYMWHGAEHILISGTYNFLNGHIESAVLREFARYENMWSEVAGADLPDTEQDSRSNVEGGASGGGASSTYTNTTTVNIGSGGGGTGASNLNDLLDVDVEGVVAQSVLYYNGTSWVDMSLPTLLNPYLKADVAANTYAKSSDLSALSTRVGANEGSIASLQSGKADKATTLAGYGIKDAYTTTQIDAKVQTINNALALRYTKTEVDAIVETINDALDDRYTKAQTNSAISTALASYYTKNEIDGKVTTINNALADRYTKTQVDGIVTTINNSITSVDNKYASTKTWADTLASLIVNENGNIRIKTNLIVNGDTASGGGSGETAIGITGILLNGTTYRDENGDGIIDLGTITSGLTSVNWSDVNGRPTSLSQFENDLGLGTLAYKNGLTASDVGALSTSGGTISGSLQTEGRLILGTGQAIEYIGNDGVSRLLFPYSGLSNQLSYYDGSSWYTLYHTGNFNPADYLPLSGGTISSGYANSLILKITNGKAVYLTFSQGGEDKAYVGYNADLGTFLQGPSGSLILTSSGATLYNNTLLHSGNIGEYKAGDSDKLGGYSASDYAVRRSYPSTSDTNWSIPSGFYPTGGVTEGLPLSGVGHHVIHCNWDGNAANQLFLAYDRDLLSFRRKHGNVWQVWKTIAFTDSNVASAQALKHSNGTVGATVDAYGGICLSQRGLWSADGGLGLFDFDGTHLNIGYSMRNSYITDIYGSSIRMCNQYSSPMFIINSSGNVTIGNGDLASVGYKLFVDGILGIGGSGNSQWVTRFVSNSEIGLDIQLGRNANNDKLPFSIAWRNDLETPPFTINPNGNVLIGTTTDNGAKLQVEGNAVINGGLSGVGLLNFSAKKHFCLNDQGHFVPNDKTSTDYWWGVQRQDGNYAISVDADDGDFLTRYTTYLAISSGNVGIGTTSPSFKLHVDGTAKINDIVRLGANLYVSQDSTAYGLQLWGDADGGYLGVHAKGSFKSTNVWFGYNGTTKLYGAVTMNSTLSVGSYMTFNNGDIMYARDEGGTLRYIMGLTSVLSLGYESAYAGIDTHIYGNSIHLHHGTSRGTGLSLYSDGSSQLHGNTTINGDVRINGNLIVTGDSASGGSAGTTGGGVTRMLSEINGTTAELEGVNVFLVDAGITLDFSNITSATPDVPCIVYLVKTIAAGIIVPSRTTSGVVMLGSSGGASSSSVSVAGFINMMMIWDEKNKLWHGHQLL